MALFTYTALDEGGRETKGEVSADTRATAMNRVSERGLHVVSVALRNSRGTKESPVRGGGRVSSARVESFTRELANLLAAGVALSRALSILCREAANPAARSQWLAIHDDVVGGAALADALARWPRSFPPVYVAMVRAGETGGFLDVVLSQIADFRSREKELLGRVKAALVYPLVLAVLATIVLVYLLTFFIPRFSSIFAQFGGALPWLTRAIVSASEAVSRYGVVIVIAGVLFFLAARRVVASDAGRRYIERILLGAPLLGLVIGRFALVRFCRMLGTLLGAGVPLVGSLKVAKEAIGNQTLADALGHAVEEVQRGRPLARSLACAPQLFPPSVVEMAAVAEESGRLDKELVRLADAYESELDRRLRMLVALVEPALLFVMAGLIGTVVIGMLLPVFTLQELIR